MPGKKRAAQQAAHRFLHDNAANGTAFTFLDLATSVGWTERTAGDYASKHFGAYLTKVDEDRYRVLPAFKRVTLDEFLDLVTQVKKPIATYERSTSDALVTYEFLLPLTKEDKLRDALDELFYADTLAQLVGEMKELLPAIFPRNSDELDDTYEARAVAMVAKLIGGYSVSHVSGRFRFASTIASREEAARSLVAKKRYLIDETTAIVRFIIPCPSSKTTHGASFDVAATPMQTDPKKFEADVRLIRGFFINIFVEAVVRTIKGEDLIWLLEDSPFGRRLYALEKRA